MVIERDMDRVKRVLCHPMHMGEREPPNGRYDGHQGAQEGGDGLGNLTPPMNSAKARCTGLCGSARPASQKGEIRRGRAQRGHECGRKGWA